MKISKFSGVVLVFIFALGFVAAVKAEEFSSDNFIIRDPLQTEGGGRATSTNFQILDAIGQLLSGEGTSTSFIQRIGLQYFPEATSPALSATPGNAQASLTWTAAVGTLANITNYEVGTAIISGGPYTFQSVGNVLSFAKTGLTNGTAYYFVIRSFAGTLFLTQSAQGSATPVAPPPPPPPGGGGGGGGGPSVATVIFSGRAYPGSKVTILKDAQIAVISPAGPDANFEITIGGLSGGNYIFSIYSEDNNGNRSTLFNFPVTLTPGVTTRISGIFLAPTIALDKLEVRRGDNIAVFGQSAPLSDITIMVNSDQELFVRTASDKNGVYLYNLDTSPLNYEQHLARSKAAIKGEISPFSKTVGFTVGTRNVFAEPTQKCPAKADLNYDCRVNLVDFSIAAYWYKRPLSFDFSQKELTLLSGDGKVDLVDFSIMAYYWTG